MSPSSVAGSGRTSAADTWQQRIADSAARLAAGDRLVPTATHRGISTTIRPVDAIGGDLWRAAIPSGGTAIDPLDPSVLLAALGQDAESAWEAGLSAGTAVPERRSVRVETPHGVAAEAVFAFVAGVVAGAGERGGLLLDSGAPAGSTVTGNAVGLAKLLTDAPANVLGPVEFADLATDLARQVGLECVVHDVGSLEALGCGGILGIGSGSDRPPRLVDLRYRPADPIGRITLAGKGVVFDSGGLSAKSPTAMMDMRSDKAGAAVVLAVLAALPALGLPIEVRGLLPLVENLPGPHSIRPGDVVTAADGTEIQVMDTDFEGRVILADALALAVRERPDLVVDLATLTYQVVIGLGPEIAGVIGRDAAVTAEWVAAGAATGEAWWPLPYATRYEHQIRTATGVRNHPMTDSGRAITAALFLGAFVPQDQPWLHADIAGPSWRGDASAEGATGFAVRTLLELLSRRARSDS